MTKAKSKRTRQLILTCLYYFAITSWLALCISAYSLGKPLLHDRLMLRVSSGSMRPSLATHVIVLVKKQAEYFPHQIITFMPSESQLQTDEESVLITHRIIDKKQFSSTKWYYLTQGDANEYADGWVAQSQVLGAMQTKLPAWWGWLIWQMTKNWMGRWLLLWMPLIVFLTKELLTIKNTFKTDK